MTKIYHNPRCSKSRQTLEILNKNNEFPEIIEYLRTPPKKEELEEIANLLDLNPSEFLRKGEDKYKELKTQFGEPTETEVLDWMCEHPILIERPIVVKNNKAKIGRPPESVEEIL